MGRFFNYFATRKDAITAIVAVLALLVGTYNYVEYKRDQRIKVALDHLERRESRIFVQSRGAIARKWIDNEKLISELAETDVYTDELLEKIGREIDLDVEYRKALFNMSTLYTNSAACTLDGLCDAAMMCASLMGEIQDYLDVNFWYFGNATLLRGEDAKALTLGMPEFVEFCDTKLFIRVASRHDRSWNCQFDLGLERLLGFHFGDSCRFASTDYDEKVEKLAARLSPTAISDEPPDQ